MNKETLVTYRTISLMIFSIALPSFVITMFMTNDFIFLLSALVAFSSMSFFLFTEAFFYSTKERSSFNILAARVFFVFSIVVAFGVLASLLMQI